MKIQDLKPGTHIYFDYENPNDSTRVVDGVYNLGEGQWAVDYSFGKTTRYSSVFTVDENLKGIYRETHICIK